MTGSALPAGQDALREQSYTRWDRLFSRRRRAAGPLVIAHRGARAIAPENTLEALTAAAVLGAEMVEVDVHLSRDRTAVLVHDADLRRCSDAARRWPAAPSYDVGDHEWADIRQLDAGSWFVESSAAGARSRYRSGTIHPPSLAECLECARGHSMLVNIEIKSQTGRVDEAARVVVADVRAAGMIDQVIVSSFDFDVLGAVRRSSVDVATAALTSNPIPAPVDCLQALDADAYHPEVSVLVGDAATWNIGALEAIEAVRRSGRGVNVWTANTADVLRALAVPAVSGIISDHPERILARYD